VNEQPDPTGSEARVRTGATQVPGRTAALLPVSTAGLKNGLPARQLWVELLRRSESSSKAEAARITVPVPELGRVDG
jgi:hypothetical protein